MAEPVCPEGCHAAWPVPPGQVGYAIPNLLAALDAPPIPMLG